MKKEEWWICKYMFILVWYVKTVGDVEILSFVYITLLFIQSSEYLLHELFLYGIPQ